MSKIDYNLDLEPMHKKIDELITNGVFNNKKIILFGANFPSVTIIHYLRHKNLNIFAIVDNDSQKLNTLFEGIKIYNPDEFLKDLINDVIILCASQFYGQMALQVEELGYTREKNFFQAVNFDELKNNFITKDDNLEELTIEEIKSISFHILKHVKNTCEKNNLRYFLCAGTLLGSIRHNGYIPWDDDIDISMPFDDYKKLIDILIKENKYTILNSDICNQVRWNYTKLLDKTTCLKEFTYPSSTNIGVCIDIFPLFGFPDNGHEVEYVKKIMDLQQLITCELYRNIYTNDNSSEKKLILYRKQLMDLYSKYQFGKTEKCYRLSVRGQEEIVNYDAYSDVVEAEFEKETFAIPKGYDEVLRCLYGNYMELPPLSKRISDHAFKAYRISSPIC